MTKSKIFKTNVTAYLPTEIIDRLDTLAEDEVRSRNNLFEEAILDLLKKKKINFNLL